MMAPRSSWDALGVPDPDGKEPPEGPGHSVSRQRPAGLPVWSPHSGLSESREWGRGIWRFRRGNGRGRGGARAWRGVRGGDRRERARGGWAPGGGGLGPGGVVVI